MDARGALVVIIYFNPSQLQLRRLRAHTQRSTAKFCIVYTHNFTHVLLCAHNLNTCYAVYGRQHDGGPRNAIAAMTAASWPSDDCTSPASSACARYSLPPPTLHLSRAAAADNAFYSFTACVVRVQHATQLTSDEHTGTPLTFYSPCLLTPVHRRNLS